MSLFDRFRAFFVTLGLRAGDTMPDAPMRQDFLPLLATEELADFRGLMRMLVEDRWFVGPGVGGEFWQVRVTERGLVALEALEAAASARNLPAEWLDDAGRGEPFQWGTLAGTLTPAKWITFLMSAFVNVVRDGNVPLYARAETAEILEELLGSEGIARQLTAHDVKRIQSIIARAIT
jgi:hypothetical protein